jgi:uncharacterized metal-binding protein
MDRPQCAKCKAKPCQEGITDESLLPKYCPLKTSKKLIQEALKRYQEEEIHSFYLNSALTEKEAYDTKAAREEDRIVPVRPRIKEIAEFAKKIGATRIGMAFCNGLSDEAARAASILEKHGLEICSVVCSCGALDKSEFGVPKDYRIKSKGKFEAGCNPLLQAELLNQASTDLNVLIGLCVGHDMLFTKHCQAYVTTLVVKDRFTGHNPVISLYTRYHKDIR